jgi:hypothetical protein
MDHYSLSSAYASYGAKAASKLRALSAIAGDGSMVLSCTPPYFVRPASGVLRYEDKLTRTPDDARGRKMLGDHLAQARDGDLTVRMVVISPAVAGRSARSVHVRNDLIGKVVQFDGDHFVVDFTRPEAPVEPKVRRRRLRS